MFLIRGDDAQSLFLMHIGEFDSLQSSMASNRSSTKAKHATVGVIQLAHGAFAREQGRAGKKGRCYYRCTFVLSHGPHANRQCEFHSRNDTSVFSSEVTGRHCRLWTIFADHDADPLTLPDGEIVMKYLAWVCKANISLHEAVHRQTFELLDSLVASGFHMLTSQPVRLT
jgi:hypothetical protein